jgi:uncharacterized protein (TIGR03435 family)
MGGLQSWRVLVAAMSAVMAAQVASAQEPGTCPEAGGLFAAYDVVSLKPVHPDTVGNTAVFHHPDGIDGANVTVEMMVRSAYAYTFGTGTGAFVNEDVITGLPAWTKNQYFALQAKMGPEQMAVFAKLDADQQRACQDNMEQAMLADRFQFKMHREPRQVPAYELVVAKGGPKLKESGELHPNAQTMTITPRSSSNGYELVLQARSMPMQQLANILTMAYWGPGHQVVDKTSLTGRYSFTLTFVPPQTTGSSGAQTVAAADPGLSIFDALGDQLGLKLERSTTTVDSVAVDHVERPTPD